ncbi:hypothetical protein [Deinococcus sp.]|uniref:hypothetical protein n=1 Tax=Deinococcus sp. TaxID=47478 RepID=UPI0025B92A93|nr:hypothetical protein [Deinococcus sp.]
MKRPLLPFLLITTASAQTGTSQQNVTFTLQQDLIKSAVTDGKGTETVIENPKTVLPGDVLREQLTLVNVSGRKLTQLLVNVPVPKGTEFAQLSTANANRWKAQYSPDGGKTFSAAPTRTVTVTENGQSVTRKVPVPTTEYTNVRWIVTDINPDETLKFAFRVKVK